MATDIIGIVYNPPLPAGETFAESSLDVLTQVKAIEAALSELKHTAVRIPFSRDLASFSRDLKDSGAEMVFNLCETVDEDACLASHPAAVLELLDIPFSGSPSKSLMLSTDKILTKRLLKATGIATPNYAVYQPPEPLSAAGLSFPVIIKPRFEDASIGISQESIAVDEAALVKKCIKLSKRFGTLLIEEYVAGREFNMSLIGFPAAKVLPLAEIEFSQYPAGLYPILDYCAKWDQTSFEYHHTVRNFPNNLSLMLQRKLEMTAHVCFRALMLRDYGRVDVRIDSRKNIYVLEINANPCLSPDAGFAAAAEKSGLTYTQMVERLVAFLSRRAV